MRSLFPVRFLRDLTPAMLVVLAAAAAPAAASADEPAPLVAETSDGVTIYGERYFGDLDDAAPLIVLFHQGGADVRTEYEPIVPWLNEAGYRAVAWDLRAGGDRFRGVNRTVVNLGPDAAIGYCESYPDLVAALEASVGEGETAVVWGSSFSATLVFRLAAEHPDDVSGVIACSPAGGGPLADCLADEWLDDVKAPMLAFRPGKEMESDGSKQQRKTFEAAGVTFHVIEEGVHGSSMFVDRRTGQDMSAARGIVLGWLEGVRGDAEAPQP